MRQDIAMEFITHAKYLLELANNNLIANFNSHQWYFADVMKYYEFT